jgi:hypothetical protein
MGQNRKSRILVRIKSQNKEARLGSGSQTGQSGLYRFQKSTFEWYGYRISDCSMLDLFSFGIDSSKIDMGSNPISE